MKREQRFEQIYRQHASAVSAYARRRTTDSLAEEIVAETFAVCWRKLDRVPENALPWLYAVARKTLANERRKRSREAALTDLPAPPLEHDHTLSLALGELKETDREVLRLVAWEGLLLREAAAVLGCSTVAARVRFHRAKRRLAARLEALEPSRCPRPHPEGAVR